MNRDDRNIRLFGADGQRHLGETRVTVVGNGGLGAAVDQQLAFLGVLDYRLIDHDVVTATSLNRLIGATPDDVGEKKVIVAQRMIKAIRPEATVAAIGRPLLEAPEAIQAADVVFGCLDKDVHRLELMNLCLDAGVPFFDLASDVDGQDDGRLTYGGRVLWSGHGERCPFCMDLLDQVSMRRDSLPLGAKADFDRIYGVSRKDLDEAGPSVVSLNGVIASIAVTEMMVWVTGLRDPRPLLTYRGERGIVSLNIDPPVEGCPYCAKAAAVRP